MLVGSTVSIEVGSMPAAARLHRRMIDRHLLRASLLADLPLIPSELF
jgi:hypothetical protein